MSLSNPPGYQGFEDPENLYPGATDNLPIVYTQSYQVRQFGVGQANTIGAPVTILGALKSPPAAMTTAAAAAINAPVVTANDIFDYAPSTTSNPNG